MRRAGLPARSARKEAGKRRIQGGFRRARYGGKARAGGEAARRRKVRTGSAVRARGACFRRGALGCGDENHPAGREAVRIPEKRALRRNHQWAGAAGIQEGRRNLPQRAAQERTG